MLNRTLFENNPAGKFSLVANRYFNRYERGGAVFGHSRIVEKNRLIITFVILGTLMQFIAGCGSQSAVPLSAIKANDQSSVKDFKGNIHYFTKRPVRIISLYVSSDEIILDLVSPDRILALSEWAHDREMRISATSGHPFR